MPADTDLVDPCLQFEILTNESLEPRLPIPPQTDDPLIPQQNLVPATELHGIADTPLSESQPGIGPEWPALAAALSTPILVVAVPLRREASKKEDAQTNPRTLALATLREVRSASIDVVPRVGDTGSWVRFLVPCPELPRIGLAHATSIGLKRDMLVAPVGLEIAASAPPTPKIETSIAGTLPYLLLRQTLSVVEPAMRLSAVTILLDRQPQRPAESFREQQVACSVGHLQPSRPSPFSLVTWSRSLSISIPDSRATNLAKPATIAMAASEGYAQALRWWTPSRRGYRINPSLPQITATIPAPFAPMHASIRLPSPKPIRPGREGTEPPRLVAVRVQPAAMPVRQQRSPLPASIPGIGLSLCPGIALGLGCVDAGNPASSWTWELRTGIDTVLPGLETIKSTPAISWAPYGEQGWQRPILPATSHSSVHPFPHLKRLSRSVTASIPDAMETRVVQLLRLASALGPGAPADCDHGVRKSSPLESLSTSDLGGTSGDSAPLARPFLIAP